MSNDFNDLCIDTYVACTRLKKVRGFGTGLRAVTHGMTLSMARTAARMLDLACESVVEEKEFTMESVCEDLGLNFEDVEKFRRIKSPIVAEEGE